MASHDRLRSPSRSMANSRLLALRHSGRDACNTYLIVGSQREWRLHVHRIGYPRRAWLGRRYSRPAFPDNFNERLRPASAAIEKAVKSDGFRSVRAVFYWLEEGDEELPEGTPYHLRIIFCFNHNDTKSPLPATADEVKRFTDAVAKCPGVSLMKAESIPDSRFPIQYLDTWQCVDFDSRSYGCVTSAPPRL